MAKAEIFCEILADGTIKFDIGKIPDEQHAEADAFVDAVEANNGGERKIIQKRAGHIHIHEKGEHEHTHSHE